MDATSQQNLIDALHARERGESQPIELATADLRGVSAPSGDLTGANLESAWLDFAALHGAHLGGANLRGAGLLGADLDGADLTRADLRGADLSEARIDGAIFTGADLRGANLDGVVGEPLSFAGSRIDRTMTVRSGLSESDLLHFLRHGAVHDDPTVIPKRVKAALDFTVPRAFEVLRLREAQTRNEFVKADEEMPLSFRMGSVWEAMMTEARTEDAAPPSARGVLPMVRADEVADLPVPQVGQTYLGVKIEEIAEARSVCATFHGVDEAGEPTTVKVFDATRYGAPLQLPVFQRGLRVLGNLSANPETAALVPTLKCVAVHGAAFTMKRYENGSLRGLASVELSTEERLEFFGRLCNAVATLHAQGAVVRTLKPENVLLDGLDPIISDVDLVDLSVVATHSGDVAGYGPYAAPEEVLGEGSRSPTADVFSLARLLVFLITGADPDEPVEEVPKLDKLEHLPPQVLNVLRRAMAPYPANRQQYVHDLKADVDGVTTRGRRRISMRPPGAVSRLKHGTTFTGTAALSTVPARSPRRSSLPSMVSLVPAPASPWLDRSLELGLAGLALAVALGLAAALLFVTVPDESVPVLGGALGLAVGLATWLLPLPKTRPVAARLISLVGGVVLVIMAGPGRLAVLRWQTQLNAGDVERRAAAVAYLVGRGHRDFAGVDLAGAVLVQRDLSRSDFSGGNLRGASLAGSMLRESNFDGTDLTEATIAGADLRLAKLGRARGLTTVHCSRSTMLPDTLQCVDDEVRPAGWKPPAPAAPAGSAAASAAVPSASASAEAPPSSADPVPSPSAAPGR